MVGLGVNSGQIDHPVPIQIDYLKVPSKNYLFSMS